MKKMLIAALAMIFLSAFTASAGSYTYEKGYRGNFGIGAGNVAGENIFQGYFALGTDHGYSFGNGFYAGLGLGVYASANSNLGMVPIYADAKYNFLDCLVSPFIESRIGMNNLVNTKSEVSLSCFMITPMIGVDIWRFTLAFYYEFNFFSEDKIDGKFDTLGLTLRFNW